MEGGSSVKVVPLKAYCATSLETKEAVERRIERGIWIEGKHYYKIQNVRERWIDIEAVEEWARNGGNSRVA
ncbi:MAG: hypothetical protein CMP19_05120 [Rickettsiales bacterium]|nr:hypothetical protein [Rickettsiales bacterium]